MENDILNHASLNDFMPINGNAVEALTFIRDHITPEILDYLERDENVDENDLTDHFWNFLHPRIVTIAKPRFDSGFYFQSKMNGSILMSVIPVKKT
jgi:hypothetical protein